MIGMQRRENKKPRVNEVIYIFNDAAAIAIVLNFPFPFLPCAVRRVSTLVASSFGFLCFLSPLPFHIFTQSKLIDLGFNIESPNAGDIGGSEY